MIIKNQSVLPVSIGIFIAIIFLFSPYQTYKTREKGLNYFKMMNEIGELLHITAKND